MAEFVVGGKVTIDASSAEKSVGNIKQQLREAQKELLSVSEKFGATSKEAVAAAKKVANFKDAIGDAKLLSDAFNPDAKFKAFSNALQGVTGGFAAVQGAQALFGSESENLTKTLAKVQGAMALSQGLNSVMEAKDSFKALGTLIKTNVSSAFGTLRGAIISTGIGALVVGLGLLIANFDKVKKVVMNLIPGLAGIADFITGIVNKITDFVGVTSEAQRETEKFIAKTEAQIKKTEDFLDANGDKYDQYTQRKIKANLDYNKKAVELAKDETRTDEEKQALLKDYRDKANREINKATDDRQKSLDEAHQKEVDKNKAKNDKLKEQADQHKKEILQADEELRKQREQIRQQIELASIKDEDEKAKKQLEFDYLNQKKVIEQSKASDIERFQTLQDLYIQFIDSTNAIDQAQKEKKAQESEDELFETIQKLEREVEADAKYAEIKKKIAEEEANAKIQALNSVGQTMESLSDIIGKETAVGKAMAIASATIQTYSAAQDAYKRGMEVPFIGSVLGPVNAALAIAQGIMRVQKIAAVQVPGTSGSGGAKMPSGQSSSAPSAPLPPQLQTTTLNQGQIQQMGNAAVRSFVLESDVSGNQERIRRLNRAARIS
jgi:hypothetical protein